MKKLKDWLWSIFGNNDSWPPPDWFRWWNVVGRLEIRYWMALVFGQKLGWLIRNPFHNLTRYRWGWKGREYTVFPDDGDTWGEEGVLNKLVLFLWEDGEIIDRHLFRSYRGKYIEYYYGWRPADGALGLALRRANSN